MYGGYMRMKNEIWKDIQGYEGKYQISNMGRFKSLNYRRTGKEKILEGYPDKDGYLFVQLWKDGKGKNCRINRLVAQAFLENPQNLPEVNHKDEDKTNNTVDNLEWCNHIYNQYYGTKRERQAKSKGKPVICITTGEIYQCATEAMRKTGVDKANIHKCCTGQYKSAGKHPITGEKLVWEYFDKKLEKFSKNS